MSIALTLAIAFAVSGPMTPVSSTADQTPQSARSTAASAEDALREDAARRWLALADAEDWQASWTATASTFQAAVTAKDFARSMEPVRAALGPVSDRKLATVNVIEENGRTFHLVRFRSDFANQPGRIERIALECEDGAYRVSGYFFE